MHCARSLRGSTLRSCGRPVGTVVEAITLQSGGAEFTESLADKLLEDPHMRESRAQTADAGEVGMHGETFPGLHLRECL